MLAKIRQGVTRRVLSELTKLGDNADSYGKFWDNFGPVMKEGLYEDAENRDDLLKLWRGRSTAVEGLTSLADYKKRMKEGQEAIFYICGDNAEKLARNPHLEGFKARGVEVLLLTDQVDDFWPTAVNEYEGKPFKSVTRGGAELDKIKSGDATNNAAQKDKPEEQIKEGDLASLVALMKLTLGNVVKDVRGSARLTSSPVCLVADEGDLDIHLERFLKQHNQIRTPSKRILELNPKHDLILKMAERAKASGAADELKDVAWLLFDQARLLDGDSVSDAGAFGERLSRFLKRAI